MGGNIERILPKPHSPNVGGSSDSEATHRLEWAKNRTCGGQKWDVQRSKMGHMEAKNGTHRGHKWGAQMPKMGHMEVAIGSSGDGQ